MTPLILTEEQLRIIQEAKGPLELQDRQGRAVALAEPYTDVELELIASSRRNQATGSASIPSAAVQEHFRRLEEIAAVENLDHARVIELLRRMRAGEQV